MTALSIRIYSTLRNSSYYVNDAQLLHAYTFFFDFSISDTQIFDILHENDDSGYRMLCSLIINIPAGLQRRGARIKPNCPYISHLWGWPYTLFSLVWHRF